MSGDLDTENALKIGGITVAATALSYAVARVLKTLGLRLAPVQEEPHAAEHDEGNIMNVSNQLNQLDAKLENLGDRFEQLIQKIDDIRERRSDDREEWIKLRGEDRLAMSKLEGDFEALRDEVRRLRAVVEPGRRTGGYAAIPTPAPQDKKGDGRG